MTIIHEIVSDAEFEYDPQEKRMIIPVRNIKHHPDKVRASDLDGCQLKHAYSKNKVRGIYEVFDGNRSTQHLMKMGEYAAYLIQEALMGKAMNTKLMSFEPEVELDSDELHLAGRADGLIEFNNTKWIVEIKNTEGRQKRSVGPCRLSYALQTIAYMLMANVDRGVIITTSKWKVSTYEVVRQKQIMRDNKAATFLVYDEKDELVDEPWNNVDDLSYNAIKQRVDERLNWMDEVATWIVNQSYSDTPLPPPERPIDNPFEDPKGWRCFWMFDKGRHVRPPLRAAKATMNCEYADMCYGVEHRDTIFVIKDKNDNWIMPDKLTEEYGENE